MKENNWILIRIKDGLKKDFIDISQFERYHIYPFRLSGNNRWIKKVLYHELCTAHVT